MPVLQGQLHVLGIYAGEGSTRLRDSETVVLLMELQRLIHRCYLFSKKSWAVFLRETGYLPEHVILRSIRAGVSKRTVHWMTFNY